jgi:hypothetical protein
LATSKTDFWKMPSVIRFASTKSLTWVPSLTIHTAPAL